MDVLKQRLAQINSATDRLKTSARAALRRAGCQPTPYNRILQSTTPSHHLNLPQPGDLQARLVQKGYSAEEAQGLSQSILRLAQELKAAYQSLYRHCCTKIVHGPGPSNYKSQLDKLKVDIELQYKNRIALAEDRVLNHDRTTFGPDVRIRSTKAAFNESAPFLEKYFGINAFPNASERRSLSENTSLSEEQIKNWFQNHRSRSRKEGHHVRRPSPGGVSVATVNSESSRSPTPSTRQSISPSTSCEDISLDETQRQKRQSTSIPQIPALDESGVPAYAYPSIYRRPHGFNLFSSTTERQAFPPPQWVRVPTNTVNPPSAPLDLDALILDFSNKLNLRDAASKKSKIEDASEPWFSGKVTKPYLAPLSALVPPGHKSSLNGTKFTPSCLRKKIAPAGRFHPFKVPSPSSSPVTLLSAARKYSRSSGPDGGLGPLSKRWSKPTPPLIDTILEFNSSDTQLTSNDVAVSSTSSFASSSVSPVLECAHPCNPKASSTHLWNVQLCADIPQFLKPFFET